MSFRELLDMDTEMVKKDLDALRKASEEVAKSSLSDIESREPKESKGYGSIRVSRDIHDTVRYLSALLGCRMQTLVRKAIAEYIVNHNEEILASHEEKHARIS